MIEPAIAGDPQQGTLWTNLTERQIQAHLGDRGHKVCRSVIRRSLRTAGFRLRKALKRKSFKQHPQRNQQFQKIQKLIARYRDRGQPVISIDTKKKEFLGNFYRGGRLYTREPIEVLDHDFVTYATGKVVPHGIYDVTRNTGHMTLGTSSDTSEFAVDSLLLWWEQHGKQAHPNARRLLILADGGGSNSARSKLFRHDLQRFVDATGLKVRLAHFAPYCSKHNPIEHRLFAQVTRACQGVVFSSMEVVKALMASTRTATGMTVSAAELCGKYLRGRKLTKAELADLRYRADRTLPQWNYSVWPAAKPGGC